MLPRWTRDASAVVVRTDWATVVFLPWVELGSMGAATFAPLTAGSRGREEARRSVKVQGSAFAEAQAAEAAAQADQLIINL